MKSSEIRDEIAAQEHFRALTLWRPWPHAIFFGGKRIENRSWKPYKDVVGQFIALHAGSKYDEDGAAWMVMKGLFDPPNPISCLKMAIVGVARVTDCVQESTDPWFFGPYGWILDDVIRLKTSVLTKGYQGLWKVDDPLREEILFNIMK